jgi:Tfp pilus assembly protein PilF
MSLLIKALESAEKGKQAELRKSGAGDAASADLVLEPLPDAQPAVGNEAPGLNFAADDLPGKAASFNTAAAASVAKARQQSEIKKDSNHQLAANVFVANQAVQNSTSPTALLMLGVAGALTIWLGLQGYQYIEKLNAPEAALVRPPPQVTAVEVTASPDVPPVPVAEPQAGVEAPAAALASIPENGVPVAKPAANVQGSVHEAAAFTGDTNVAARSAATGSKTAAKKITDSRVAEYADVAADGYAEPKKGTPLKLVSRTPAAGVDPTLLAAYQAYSRGDDATAQKQYRQVLQNDIRNVDALLGMAAIAVRQSRYADANGWYQKVLEIEPRNSTALSAIANSQISTESAASAAADNAGTESRIKSMLAQQPEAANLHAALGNLYAAQNQWPLAQAAYFNASRYAPNSADYAFNLAISLDQLGKPGLALAQYQRALSLLNNSGDALSSPGASNLDKAQLEARIQALQH